MSQGFEGRVPGEVTSYEMGLEDSVGSPPFTFSTRALTFLIPALPLDPKGQDSPLQWNHLLCPWPISCRLSERRVEIPRVARYPTVSPAHPLLQYFQQSKVGGQISE